MSLKLQLVADDAQFRQALRTLLEREVDLVVVGEAGDAGEACVRASSVNPDVVIVDGDLRAGDACAVTRAVRARRARTRVLVLSFGPTPHGAHAALGTGASGIAGKMQPPRELLGAIRVVGQGGSYLCPSVVAAAGSDAARGRLNDRELEVYRLLADGRSEAAIARDLRISPRTLRALTSRILAKLGVGSAARRS